MRFFKKSSFWLTSVLTLLAGGAFSAFIPLFTGIFIARIFSPAAFGIFAQFSTFAACVICISSLRFEQALPMAAPDFRARALFWLSLFLIIFSSLFSVLILNFSDFNFGFDFVELWLFVYILSNSFWQLAIMWANRIGDFAFISIARAFAWGGGALLQLFLGAVFFYFHNKSLDESFVFLLILSTICAHLIPVFYFFTKNKISNFFPIPKPKALKIISLRFKDFALHNTPQAFLNLFQDAFLLMLVGYFYGAAEAGFWAICSRYIKSGINIFSGSISSVFYSKLAGISNDFNSVKREIRRVILFLISLSFFMFAILFWGGEFLFAAIFGDKWSLSGKLASSLSIYFTMSFICAPLSIVPNVLNAQAWAFRFSIYGFICLFFGFLFGNWIWGDFLGAGFGISIFMFFYFSFFIFKLYFWKKN